MFNFKFDFEVQLLASTVVDEDVVFHNGLLMVYG